MLSYQTLDSIADAYIPLLAFVAIAFIIVALIRKEWQLAVRRFFSVLSGLGIAYGLMFIDNALRIWSRQGLDYSTHTAVALVLITFLVFCSKPLSLLWLGSFATYVLLMLYQGYHTVADIISTVAVVGALNWVAMPHIMGKRPKPQPNAVKTVPAILALFLIQFCLLFLIESS